MNGLRQANLLSIEVRMVPLIGYGFHYVDSRSSKYWRQIEFEHPKYEILIDINIWMLHRFSFWVDLAIKPIRKDIDLLSEHVKQHGHYSFGIEFRLIVVGMATESFEMYCFVDYAYKYIEPKSISSVNSTLQHIGYMKFRVGLNVGVNKAKAKLVTLYHYRANPAFLLIMVKWVFNQDPESQTFPGLQVEYFYPIYS